MDINRRSVLRTGLATSAALPSLGALFSRASINSENLEPTVDQNTGLPLIKLPKDFIYTTFSWAGDPMRNGVPIPKRHDGMAVVPGQTENEYWLLRNHENWFEPRIEGEGASVYDAINSSIKVGTQQVGLICGGGVTGLSFVDGKYVDTVPLLGGTMVNCAGGPTPWGTWLTCEEIVLRGSKLPIVDEKLVDHGYVFEVPPPDLGKPSAKPIKEMGLYRHEAAAVDPKTSNTYLTEDNGPNSGLYRFIPSDKSMKLGSLERGGELQMLKVKGDDNTNLVDIKLGDTFDVEWVNVAEPDADPEGLDSVTAATMWMTRGKSGPYLQGEMLGGARFSRLEGIWYADGRMYFVDTDSGPARAGTLWILDTETDRLVVHYTSPAELTADAIDNVTVNETSGMILACEDGGGVRDGERVVYGSRILLIKPDGIAVPIAENNIQITQAIEDKPQVEVGDYRGQEWAGATFSPDGQTLFANIQTPGITFAISGPWSSL